MSWIYEKNWVKQKENRNLFLWKKVLIFLFNSIFWKGDINLISVLEDQV